MKANIWIGLGFVVLAILLGYLHYKKVLGDSWLGRADQVASVVSLLIAVISFINPFDSSGSASRSQNASIGNNSSGSVIAQSGDNSNIRIGDTTTSAQQRSIDALERVKTELLDNFSNIALHIKSIEDQPPEAFWDKRRTNETEEAYQDRARNEFRDYERFIQTLNTQLKFSGQLTSIFQRELAFDPKVARHITRSYDQQREAKESLESLESSLQHLLVLSLSDQERTADAQSLHAEKTATAKLFLAEAASAFCLIADTSDMGTLMDAFSLIGVDVQFRPGEEGHRTAKELASDFSKKRTEIVRARSKDQAAAQQREVNRRVNDPYLLMLRRVAGLPPTLSEAEITSLRQRRINRTETDPAELFSMAALSYLESDGEAAITYFQRAVDTQELSPLQNTYAVTSLDRLKHPEKYERSLGVMVIELTEGGNFENAGLEIGDVILSVRKETVNEPMDIATALSTANRGETIPLMILRDGQRRIVDVKARQSAAAVLSPLIILNGVQL